MAQIDGRQTLVSRIANQRQTEDNVSAATIGMLLGVVITILALGVWS